MEYVIRGLTFAIIPIIVSGVLALLHRPKKTEKGKVCLPIALAIVGVICSAAFLIPTFICAFSDESKETAPVFLVLSMLCASLIVAYINCRIYYDEEGFTAKNFFGIKRRFSYDQITGIKGNMHETYLYMGKRRIMIDDFGVGGLDFIWFANKKYRKLHKKPIPEQITKDIFNGNIRSPGEFLFVFISIGAICIALLIFTVYICLSSQPSTPNDTVKQQVVFQSCQKNFGNWILTTTDDQRYQILNTDATFDSEQIKAICDGKTVLTAYSNSVSPRYGQFYYSIQALVHDGEYILTFEETHQFEKHGDLILIFFVLGINLIWGIFVTSAIIVGRNTTKFNPKIVEIFFKSGVIKYKDAGKPSTSTKRK